MIKETIFAIVLVVVMIAGAVYVTQSEEDPLPNNNGEVVEPDNGENNNDMSELVQCLQEKNVVVYGSYTCPACSQLVDDFGGSDVIKPIYVECTGIAGEEEANRCENEMQTRYVPEIQIDGELYEGSRSPQALAEEISCEI